MYCVVVDMCHTFVLGWKQSRNHRDVNMYHICTYMDVSFVALKTSKQRGILMLVHLFSVFSPQEDVS